ncbi:MAG: helix-turn-helix domain-containing protein [Candidatus Sericytochromatia bacterium]|nr:helix-turn-helix domain-containing protein [Candidatus Sericytochromatia bacterium]
MNISFLSPGNTGAAPTRLPAGPDPLAEAQLLAGRRPLPGELAQILVLETDRPEQWLQGGELVVAGTAFLAEKGSCWVDGLAAGQAMGLLACGEGRLPDALVENARHHGLSLLCHEGDPAPLARQLQRLQAQGRPWLLAQCMNRQQELVRMAIAGGSATTLLEAIAQDLGRALLLEDERFNRLAQAGLADVDHAPDDSEGSCEAVILAARRHPDWERFTQGRAALDLLTEEQPEARRTLWPLMRGERLVGSLAILGTPLRRDELHLARVQAGLTALAILVGGREEEADPRGSFYFDLLQRPGAFSRSEIHRRAHWLGMPLAQRYWPLAVAFDRSLPLPQAEALRQRLQTTLAAILSFRQCIIVPQTFGASILVPMTADPPAIEQMRRLALTIRDRLGAQGDTVSVGVGLSSGDLLSLGRQHQEAVQALKIGRTLHGPGQVHCFDDMGVYRMLYQFAAERSPGAFLCEALSRLMAYDQQADKELVKTLGAFLDCNGNLTETSERLFIHRNTLKYRLERIRDITQVDLDTAETRLMLHIGLKMQQILDAQAG